MLGDETWNKKVKVDELRGRRRKRTIRRSRAKLSWDAFGRYSTLGHAPLDGSPRLRIAIELKDRLSITSTQSRS